MECNAKMLSNKIDEYFAGAITKSELGEWANRAYYDLLKGDYIEVDKIVIYPFVKAISTFHVKENDKDDCYPCSEEDVKAVQDILHGKKDFDFVVEVSLPVQTYSMFEKNQCFDEERRDIFSGLRDMLISYSEQGYSPDREMEMRIKSVMPLKHQDKVILGLLEEHILFFMRILFSEKPAGLEIQNHLKLYAQKSEQNIMMERLIRYLDCYIGSRNFQLLVAYKDGKPQITIDV